MKGTTLSNHLDRITMDDSVCHGKPVIRHLRYPVEMLLELMSSGMSIEEILMDYEDLEREDLLASLEYAAKLTKIKKIESIPAARNYRICRCGGQNYHHERG